MAATASDYVDLDPVITPGARVVIRDAEWIVRRVDNAPSGFQLVCDGVDELVRGREAVFLTALEPPIQVLDPANTELVPDESAQFSDSILYMESRLRQAVPNDAEIHIGHTAAMDLVPYRTGPACPRPTPAAHPDRGRRRPRQDDGGRDPRERTDRPRTGPACRDRARG